MNITGSRIVAMGHYQPSRRLTNADLMAIVDTNDEWILSRVGISERRTIDSRESLSDLATEAARIALDRAAMTAGTTAADIDLVIVASCTVTENCPNTATKVAANLGLTTAPAAYDLNTACSGFAYALATADHAIRAGAARTALVIGAEQLTRFTDYTDRATCILFGDGAGAAVITATTGDEPPGIGPVLWGSAPEKGDVLTIKRYVWQDGQSVFRWASSLAPLAREACAKAGIDPADLAAFVPHQANVRIIDAIARRLGATNAIVAKDIVLSGNTSSASIPIAFAKLLEEENIPSGAPVLFFGFGGGLTYAGQVVLAP